MNKDYQKEYSDKNPIEKISYFCQTIYNTCEFYCNILPNLIRQPNGAILLYPNKNHTYDNLEWNNSNDGLIVVIHGLLGSPKTLGYEIAKKISLNKNNGKYEILLPIIPFKGNCSLETASKPLYDLIFNYIKVNPDKPIHFIACSNGCRIASWIECELRNLVVNIRLTCIVGAFGGSVLVDNFKIPLSIVLHNDVLKELSTESKINNTLKEKMSLKLELGTRFYEFYGTANDWYILNFNDCFPIINSNNLDNNNFQVVYHDLKYGYDHVSLGWYFSNEIVKNSIDWMNEINKINKINNLKK